MVNIVYRKVTPESYNGKKKEKTFKEVLNYYTIKPRKEGETTIALGIDPNKKP